MAVILLTRSDLEDAFYRMVGESSGNSRWDSDDAVHWLQEGQLDIVNATRCLEETWSSTVTAYSSSGDEVLALPNNLFDDGILQIYWVDSSSDYHELSETHPRFATIQNDDTGTPSEFFRVGSNINLKPKPDAAGTVVIVGHKMPDSLTATSSQSLIPAQFRKLIAQYAAWMAFSEDAEHEKAFSMMREYEQGIKELKKWAKKRRSKRTSRMVMPYTL